MKKSNDIEVDCEVYYIINKRYQILLDLNWSQDMWVGG